MNSFDGALRRYATPTTAVLSVVVGVTGTILFFHLAKGATETIHEWLGMAFALAAILHVVRHRVSFAQLLKQTHMRVMAAVLALGVASFVVLAPAKPPGNPMIRLALAAHQAPIAQLAPAIGNTPDQVLARLRRAGIDGRPEDSLASLAAAHGMEPMKMIALALPPERVP
jgi:hypothetical protein